MQKQFIVTHKGYWIDVTDLLQKGVTPAQIGFDLYDFKNLVSVVIAKHDSDSIVDDYQMQCDFIESSMIIVSYDESAQMFRYVWEGCEQMFYGASDTVRRRPKTEAYTALAHFHL